MLYGGEVFSPETKGIATSEFAEIHASDAVARCSWADYLRRISTDGLMSDHIHRLLGILQITARVVAKIKGECDTFSDKLANIRIDPA